MEFIDEFCLRHFSDLDSLLNSNELWKGLYERFYLETTEKMRLDISGLPSALEVFNAVYCQCIKTLKDNHPEDMFVQKYLEECFASKGTYTDFSVLTASMTYIVLSLSNQVNNDNVRRFRRKAKNLLGHDRYIFDDAENFILLTTEEYYIDLLEPKNPDELEALDDVVWHKITHGFSQKRISELLKLWSYNSDRKKVWHKIKVAFDSNPNYEITSKYNAPDFDKLYREASGYFDDGYIDICECIQGKPIPTSESDKISIYFGDLEDSKKSLKDKVESLEKQNDLLKQENAKLNAELSKLKKTDEKQKEAVDEQLQEARMQGMLSLIEEIVSYAEALPQTQNREASVIRDLLLTKYFINVIDNKIFSPKLKERLLKLGKKEISSRSMFEITGNHNVNIGGQ